MSQEIHIAILSLHPSGSRVAAGIKKAQQLLSQIKNWQRPTFPGSFPPSIIGAKELNFCVRDGNRCGLPAIVTGFFLLKAYLQN